MVNRPLIKLDGVEVRRRGKTILGPINLDLEESGFTIVLGPNGAGKTTFLKALHGIERLSGGEVNWAIGDTDLRAQQAYVFQNPTMLRRSVRANLAYPLKLLRVNKSEISRRVEHWAKRSGMETLLDSPATRLSGGERQKLALARALIRDPKVLFLDEPCASLDGKSTREIEALLLETHQSGTRIIMTTHNLGQAKRLATDVVFLLNGRLHEQSPAGPFFSAPDQPEAQSFLKGDIVE